MPKGRWIPYIDVTVRKATKAAKTPHDGTAEFDLVIVEG